MRLFGFLIVISMFLTGCVAHSGAVIDTGERYSPLSAGTEDYRLGVGDKVKITVFDEPTLSGEFAINADGAIALPLVGNLPAVGKKASEIGEEFQAALANGYLRDPKVSAEITTYRPFFVLGEVKLPGQYPYSSGMTVLNAIAVAQGYTPRASRAVVYIRRAGSETEQAYRLQPDLRVWPGDTIRVGERYF